MTTDETPTQPSEQPEPDTTGHVIFPQAQLDLKAGASETLLVDATAATPLAPPPANLKRGKNKDMGVF